MNNDNEEMKMNKTMKFVAISAVALSLGACNATTMGKVGGGLLGAAGGGFAGNQFGKGLGNKLATAGGVIAGTGLGAFLGNSLTMPYENRDGVNRNAIAVDRNGRRIIENGYRIDANGQRINDVNSRGYNFDCTPRRSTPRYRSNGGGGGQTNMDCRVLNNYVTCNSN